MSRIKTIELVVTFEDGRVVKLDPSDENGMKSISEVNIESYLNSMGDVGEW